MDNGELFVYVFPRLTENTTIRKRMTLPKFHIYQSQIEIERIYYIFITGVLVVTYPMIPILWLSLSTIADGEMYCPNSSFTSVKSQLAHTIGKVSFFKNGRKPSKLSSNS